MKKLYVLMMVILLSGCQNIQMGKNQTLDFNIGRLSHVDLVKLQVQQMTLKEKLYQSMILGFQGTSMNAELQTLLDNKLGGVILFSRNIVSAEQTAALNQSIYQSATVKPFIAVDQEGGRVNRLPQSMGNTPSAYQLGLSNDRDYIYNQGQWIGKALKVLHFNLDFSTVLDTWTNPANTVIGDRSFGSTPEAVIDNAKPFNKGIHDEGIITSGKHFPGHGDTTVDSHIGLPVDNDPVSRLTSIEMKPFMAMHNQVDMMMVSHIMATSIDDRPSSLSKKMIGEYLRGKVGFKGVIITDDLAMGAIEENFSRIDAVTQAFQAGNTMILIGSDIGDIPQLVSQLEQKVQAGEINKEQIDENVEKIIRLKLKYGIL